MRHTAEANCHTNRPPGPAPSRASATIRAWLPITSVLAISCLLALVSLAAAFNRWPYLSPSTPDRMQQMGLVFKMCAIESEGHRWPHLARNSAIWAPDIAHIFPEYVSDPIVFVARKHPAHDAIVTCLEFALGGSNPDYDTAAALMAMSFAYLDCSVIGEPGFRALVDARQQGLLDGSIETVTVPDSGETVFPMREEIGCNFLGRVPFNPGPFPPGTQSARPVLVETWGWRHKSSPAEFTGANVLYMDGHVAWVALGEFPVVPEVLDVLSGLAVGMPVNSTQAE